MGLISINLHVQLRTTGAMLSGLKLQCRSVMHQPTNSTLPQPPLDSATLISYTVRIFWRSVDIQQNFCHTFTADELPVKIISIRSIDPDLLKKSNNSATFLSHNLLPLSLFPFQSFFSLLYLLLLGSAK